MFTILCTYGRLLVSGAVIKHKRVYGGGGVDGGVGGALLPRQLQELGLLSAWLLQTYIVIILEIPSKLSLVLNINSFCLENPLFG